MDLRYSDWGFGYFSRTASHARTAHVLVFVIVCYLLMTRTAGGGLLPLELSFFFVLISYNFAYTNCSYIGFCAYVIFVYEENSRGWTFATRNEVFLVLFSYKFAHTNCSYISFLCLCVFCLWREQPGGGLLLLELWFFGTFLVYLRIHELLVYYFSCLCVLCLRGEQPGADYRYSDRGFWYIFRNTSHARTAHVLVFVLMCSLLMTRTAGGGLLLLGLWF